MFTFGRTLFVFSLLIWAPAQAQSAPPPSGPQNLDAGKSVAQMFASDCAICHKTPQSVARGGGMFGIESFLRAHYTTSRESAAALAGYLRAVAAIPAPARARAKQAPKGDAKKPGAEPAKTSASPDDKKPGDEVKPAEAKPAEAKSAEPKPAETRPAETKPAESKPADANPADSKSE